MANNEHDALLRDGASNPWDWRTPGDPEQLQRNPWNRWREENPDVKPDLSDSDFSGLDCRHLDLTRADFRHSDLRQTNLSKADLTNANLSKANLQGASLRDATLIAADFTGANLSTGPVNIITDASGACFWDAVMRKADLSDSYFVGAQLRGADLSEAVLRATNFGAANLRETKLRGANLSGAILSGADCTGADLSDANLRQVFAIATDFTKANLTGCRIYGIAAWDVTLDDATQSELIITDTEPYVRVDDLEVAQFIYLLLNRRKLRNVLTTLGEKAVLVLGRFTERKVLLELIAKKLREIGYLPIIFDFDRPTDRDLTETVKILAGLSRFVIADITNPSSVPLELQAVVPDYMVPFVTIIQRGQPAFGMFDDLPRKYHWALPLLEYESAETLIANFERKIVTPAVSKLTEVRQQKALAVIRRSAED